MMYKRIIKPIFDVIFSFLGLVVLFVPMVMIAVAIKLDDPGPVFFKQKRFGKGKSYFMLYKFRTMKTGTPDIPTHLLEDPQAYITRVGGFLRKTSLDELPQLVNILTQKMSIVGPRPALWNQEDLIAERDRYGANGLLPGLTGWAQINGRDTIEIEEKARLDGEYAKRISFLFDCRCLIGTVGSVLRREDVLEGGTGAAQEPKKEVAEK